jgi:hypothetical protein
MAVRMSEVLPCIAVVNPGVIVEEPGARVIGLSDEVCVPVAGYAIVVRINYYQRH